MVAQGSNSADQEVATKGQTSVRLPGPVLLLLVALLLFMSGTMTASVLGWAGSTRLDPCSATDLAAGQGGVDLRGAEISGSMLAGANLCGADLRGAVLRDACLRGANLDAADLTGAILEGSDFSGASTQRTRGLPTTLPRSTSACSTK
jgi:hypothetical protein